MRWTLRPTADATRLILPPRTSPTANTPADWFEQMRRPGGRPMGGGQSSCTDPVPVLTNPFASSATQPRSQSVLGYRPGHDKDMADLMVSIRRLMVAPAHAFEMITASRATIRCWSEDNGRVLFDAANQIARHDVRHPAGAYEHSPVSPSVPETPQLGPPLPPPTTPLFFTTTQLRFHKCRAVVTPPPLKLR